MRKKEFSSKPKSKVYLVLVPFLALFLTFAIVYFLWSLMQYNEAMEKKQEKERQHKRKAIEAAAKQAAKDAATLEKYRQKYEKQRLKGK